MRITFAYLGVVLLWATTPLAIQWSSGGWGYLFGVTARMSLGLVGVGLILLILRLRLPWHAKARRTYAAVFLQIYASMLTVYWAARFIPSGWISVIFGLTPFLTALLSAAFLRERSLTLGKLTAYALGVGGLTIMADSAIELNDQALYGIVGILAAAVFQAASSVWIKRIDAGLPVFVQIGGGLLLAVPAYWLTWYLVDRADWPQAVSARALWAVVYLGIVATTFGFALYYFILTRLPATSVALINLMTPVLSLLIGNLINNEPITGKVSIGTGMILFALVVHEFGKRALKPTRCPPP